jgi:hypothetical protein
VLTASPFRSATQVSSARKRFEWTSTGTFGAAFEEGWIETLNDPRRIAGDDRPGFDIGSYHRSGPNNGSLADCSSLQYGGTETDPDIVAYRYRRGPNITSGGWVADAGDRPILVMPKDRIERVRIRVVNVYAM